MDKSVGGEEPATTSPTKVRHIAIREEETDLSYRRPLGKGGYGEVHEVRHFSYCSADSQKAI
jgi:hypothetical protein